MPQTMIPWRTTATACLLLVALLVVGCGSDGGSGSSKVTVGTYRGTINLTASGGGVSVPGSGPIVLTVTPAQTVTIGSFPGEAPIQNGSFTLVNDASFLNGPRLTCGGTIFNSGTFQGNTVTGTASSQGLVCNGFPMSLSGSFSATLAAAERARGQAEANVLEAYRAAIERALGGKP